MRHGAPPSRLPESNSSSDLRQRLAAMSTSEQEHELLDVVRSNAAAVLGHDSADAVGTDQEFQGARLRFIGCGRVPESPQIGDRFEAAHHRCLRSPDTDSVGPVPGQCTRQRRGFRLRGRAKRPAKPTKHPARVLAVDGLSARHPRNQCTISGSPDRAGSRLRPSGRRGESGADA